MPVRRRRAAGVVGRIGGAGHDVPIACHHRLLRMRSMRTHPCSSCQYDYPPRDTSVVSHKYAYESAGPFGRRLRCSSSRGVGHWGGDRRSPLQVIAPCRQPKCPRIFITVFVRHHTSGDRCSGANSTSSISRKPTGRPHSPTRGHPVRLTTGEHWMTLMARVHRDVGDPRHRSNASDTPDATRLEIFLTADAHMCISVS